MLPVVPESLLEIPDFAVDLFHQVQAAIKSFESTGSGVTFLDTLSDTRINLPCDSPPSQWGQIQFGKIGGD